MVDGVCAVFHIPPKVNIPNQILSVFIDAPFRNRPFLFILEIVEWSLPFSVP